MKPSDHNQLSELVKEIVRRQEGDMHASAKFTLLVESAQVKELKAKMGESSLPEGKGEDSFFLKTVRDMVRKKPRSDPIARIAKFEK